MEEGELGGMGELAGGLASTNGEVSISHACCSSNTAVGSTTGRVQDNNPG